MKEEGLIRASQ